MSQSSRIWWDDGYEAKFEVPYDQRLSLKGNEVLDGTLVISDADEGEKQETLIATSPVKPKLSWTWGMVYLRGKRDLPELSAEFIAASY
ncbi:hypothetical protein JQX13_35755 [Archangium violaceum]|uniref:hypothetical protein n=1 Tax=Archangium violaceum TaxID=83451 RepID=UPI00193AF598|nr:hypothetical protein [Archangium violaceum]QRK05489.1 hypothetical protein JQX13_35755 [Archangium violaceum]